MVSFVEKNKDFVIKLKIKGADGQTQIRRVCLPRIADANGNISYEELIGLVIVFTVPEEDTATNGTGKYTVSITYYDNEKDLITVASTEELMEAIGLFDRQKFMRITTCVKPKISSSAPSTPAAAHAQDTPPASPSVDRGTSTHADEYPPTPPIQLVLESFAGILTSAVNHLEGAVNHLEGSVNHFEEGLATQSSHSNKPNDSCKTSLPTEDEVKPEETATPPSTTLKKPPPKAKSGVRNRRGKKAKAAKVDETSNKPASCNSATACPDMIPYTEDANEASSKVNSSNTKEEVHTESVDSTKEIEETAAAKPFIHGRHTCDVCLTTPIIGKRFKSINLPDYDLCQNCFDNYKGSEIKYESVELNRDLAFQNRWHRRHQKTVVMMKRRGRPGRGGCGPRVRRFRGRSHGTFDGHGRARYVVRGDAQSPSEVVHDAPSSTPLPNPISSDSNASDSDRIRDDSDSPAQNDIGSSQDFDSLLKEAIRRSLDDIVPKASIAEASIAKSNEGGKTKKNLSQETSKCSKERTVVENSVSKKAISDTKDDIPRSVEIVERKMADELAISGDSTLDIPNVSNELKEVETLEQSMETDSVDSEKLLLEAKEAATIPSPIAATVTDDHSKVSCSEQRSLNISKDDSFASDAVGNGDVAEVMGKTLDMVVGVISEMLSESEDLKPPYIENGKEMANESKMGELIVNSNDGIVKTVDDEEDDTDWSVVKSVGSSETTESEQIGKAAELLGSALFNSDMQHSTEDDVYNLMGSDSSFSIPSSVPTDLGTVHSRVAAPTRWASELEKLLELGFDNEASCIDILERLEFSDPGTDSTGIPLPIIDRVVNELLELNAE